MSRLLWILLFALVATGCRSVPSRPPAADAAGAAEVNAQLAAQSAREAGLADDDHWRMSGRLAVSAGRDGGSGRIVWEQSGDDFRITLSAPVTRRSWVLTREQGLVRLTGLDGGDRVGSDAEALLAEATGWRLPVQALSAWARGARAAGPARIEFAGDGLPLLIDQQGWQVEYRDWLDGEPALPRRVFARQGEASVRLVVERWDRP